ncbi:MAG TPA: hypothetical protein VHB48_19925 [Chitinophagaceae bacterium]|nr:hypothetical protein [Chitinophagaceae bacterium]
MTELPEELLNIKIPIIRTQDNTVVIENRNTIYDYLALVVLVVGAAACATKSFEYHTEYTFILSCAACIAAWLLFTRDTVTIDVNCGKIARKNSNPVVNSIRKRFHLTSKITFAEAKDVQGIFLKGLGKNHATYIGTQTGRFYIAGFACYSDAAIFEKFLKELLHIHDPKFTGWDFLHV